MLLPGGVVGSDFGHTLERIIAPLGANVDCRPALGGRDDIRELQKAGVPAVSLRQDGLDYFDTRHTADDTLDKIDPKQLDQAKQSNRYSSRQCPFACLRRHRQLANPN